MDLSKAVSTSVTMWVAFIRVSLGLLGTFLVFLLFLHTIGDGFRELEVCYIAL
jgi:hypothetical protein